MNAQDCDVTLNKTGRFSNCVEVLVVLLSSVNLIFLYWFACEGAQYNYNFITSVAKSEQCFFYITVRILTRKIIQREKKMFQRI